jgi:ERCC4-type nuclease
MKYVWKIIKNVVIQKTMLYILEQIGYENVWILTTSIPEIRELKTKVILKNLDVLPEHIIHSNSDAHKVELLKDLHDKEKKDIIFVEDTAYTLMSAEDNLDFVKGYHISSIIP